VPYKYVGKYDKLVRDLEKIKIGKKKLTEEVTKSE
jgi:hypothetical protein